MGSTRRNNNSSDTDVVIIGAGAAGLASATALAQAGVHATLVEARDRIGGRIHTDILHAADVPIELGAEFVHGESASVFAQLHHAGVPAVDLGGERWSVEHGRLRRADDRLGLMHDHFEAITPPDPDVSFAEFLERHARQFKPEVIKLARSMVEGFDAADATRISAREVLAEWSGPAAAGGPTFRPLSGYGPVMAAMLRGLTPERVSLRLSTVVHSIEWRKRRVVVTGECLGDTVRIEAARAIVTVPLGVLQTGPSTPGHVRFEPELPRPKREALRQLASGPVVKLVLQFAEPFWTRLDGGRYRDAGFFFVPDAPFPTFWTSMPIRSPVLVAWCAGPKAERWSGAPENGMLDALRTSLRALFGRRDYTALLERVAWHDWQGDPYARGAYSYVLVNGSRARRALARATDDTLYFAGEATDTTGEAATVGGALQSGLAAAKQVAQSMGKLRRSR